MPEPEKIPEYKPAPSKPNTIDISALCIPARADSGKLVRGRNIKERAITVKQAMDEIGGKVVVWGDVFGKDVKDIKGEKVVLTFSVTDYTGSVIIKSFEKKADLKNMLYGKIKKGSRIAVKGKIENDTYAKDISILADSIILVEADDGRTDTAENGQIVVALVDGFEVTLKRLRRQGSSIALEPENPAYQTRILPASRVAVQGRLIGLMRNY